MSEFICREQVDLIKAQIVYDNIDQLKEKLGRFVDSKYHYVEFEKVKTIIHNFIKNKSKTEEVAYKYSGNKSEGRLFSKGPSLQNLSRPFRHTIAKEFYDDIDIDNCHPKLFEQLCDRYELVHKHLSYYNNNRAKCLQELMSTQKCSKDEAKMKMLSLLNGGAPSIYESKDIDLEWYQNYYDEVCKLRSRLLDLEEFKIYKTNAKKAKKTNIDGTAINNVFCKYEDEILHVIIAYCEKMNYEIGALVFDGLMLYKDPNRDNNKLLKDLSDIILQKTGFNLSLSIKEMKEDINLDGLKKKQDKDKENDSEMEKMGLATDQLKVEQIHLLEKDHVKITYMNGDKYFGYIWNPQTLLWEKKSKDGIRLYLINSLQIFIKERINTLLNTKDPDKYEFAINCLKKTLTTTQRGAVQNSIFAICKAYFEDFDFKDKLDLANSPYLAIKGGKLYNLETGKITDRTINNYFSKELPVSLTENIDIAHKYIFDLVKNNKDRYDILLTIMGYFFSNLNTAKLFFIFIGEPDTGKSTFFEFIGTLMGHFSYDMASRGIMTTKTKSNHEDELIKAITNTKMSIVKEIHSSEELCPSVVKRIVGNDKQTLRACGKEAVNMNTITKVGMLVNVKPEYNRELEGKIYHFEFPNKYNKNDEVGQKYVSSLKANQEFLDGLFSLIMKYTKKFYIDRKIPNSIDNIKYDINSIQEWIDERCEVGSDSTSNEYRYQASKCRDDYEYWCNKYKKSIESKDFFKSFIIKLTENEIKQSKFTDWRGNRANNKCYIGIRPALDIIEDEDEEEVNQKNIKHKRILKITHEISSDSLESNNNYN